MKLQYSSSRATGIARARRGILFLTILLPALVFAFWAINHWSLVDKFTYWRVQNDCLNYNALEGTRVVSITIPPNHQAFPVRRQSTRADRLWTDLADRTFAQGLFSSAASARSPVVFLHGLTNASGVHLVVISLSVNDGELTFHSEVAKASQFGNKLRWFDHFVEQGGFLVDPDDLQIHLQSLPKTPTRRVSVFEGLPDPRHRDRFSIQMAVDAEHWMIRGVLSDDHHVKLSVERESGP